MKIVISDYQNTLERELDYEIEIIHKSFPDADVVIHPFENKESFIQELKDADGLLTAFLPLDESIFSKCTKLKCISLNSTGYNTVNLEDAKKYGITVCAIKEYCTTEVAEFTMSLILNLSKKLKEHQYNIEKEKRYQYELVGSVNRLSGKTLAIFGFGRIGQTVARFAQAFNMNVVTVDPFIPEEITKKANVKLVDREYVFENADIISNHMSTVSTNSAYFNDEFFLNLKKKPIFVNVGRGISVDESALLNALSKKYIASAGLDVLEDENPDVINNPLFGRNDVIITPHAAFYSVESMKLLQEISTENLVNYFKNEISKINHIVI